MLSPPFVEHDSKIGIIVVIEITGYSIVTIVRVRECSQTGANGLNQNSHSDNYWYANHCQDNAKFTDI